MECDDPIVGCSDSSWIGKDTEIEYLESSDSETSDVINFKDLNACTEELCKIEQFSITIDHESSEICDPNVEKTTKRTCRKKRSYACDTCAAVFHSQPKYRSHLKQHGNERFSCIQCNASFPSMYRLKKHEMCHKNDTELYKCEECARSYRDHSNLRRHIKIAHYNMKQYSCSLCPQTFGRPDVLKTHMVKHDTEKNFLCQLCGKQFKSQRYLDIHMKTHDRVDREQKEIMERGMDEPMQKENTRKIRLFTCPYCGKEFRQHFTYKNHIRTHTDERPYCCGNCHKAFRTKAALETHQRIHSDVRPYPCCYCAMTFRQKAHLKDHMSSHTGKMRFPCDVCGADFAKKSNMISHRLLHSENKLFECFICLEKFYNNAQLQRHMRRFHLTKIDNWDYTDSSLIVVDHTTTANELIDYGTQPGELNSPLQVVVYEEL